MSQFAKWPSPVEPQVGGVNCSTLVDVTLSWRIPWHFGYGISGMFPVRSDPLVDAALR
jgi:hypothetical protein